MVETGGRLEMRTLNMLLGTSSLLIFIKTSNILKYEIRHLSDSDESLNTKLNFRHINSYQMFIIFQKHAD